MSEEHEQPEDKKSPNKLYYWVFEPGYVEKFREMAAQCLCEINEETFCE